MRVVIAGAGSVGRSIARELLAHGHEVTLIDRHPAAMRIASVPDAEWQLADACEISTLTEADLATCDVVVAATGDDKANLVVSLLAKTEFGVPRVVARVNNPKNEWMFDAAWGVDVPVSTPRIMTALVEEAVSVGDLVRIFTFHGSATSLHEVTLAPGSPVAGRTVREVDWGPGCFLAALIRAGEAVPPEGDERMVAGDRLVLVLSERADPAALQELLAPARGAT
ncbi:TrkA family potassium uptake protein [uncultured Georgenia sp.]|uniref:potassium channel family protein n=1 Tax=uncultured Georgenia sp. TaxID=378209 RepID=UPI00262E6F7E|nr:TrkA family potassium uptake protein [uncultured Georgenia sp.]HLV05910.1 TrkA family potassium uptake protein [Actinomycetaceae bacterium]